MLALNLRFQEENRFNGLQKQSLAIQRLSVQTVNHYKKPETEQMQSGIKYIFYDTLRPVLRVLIRNNLMVFEFSCS